MMVHTDDVQKGDALTRAWRTFGQGALIAAVVSVGTVLTALDAEPDWKTVLIACGQAAATAIVTYVHNKMRPPTAL